MPRRRIKNSVSAKPAAYLVLILVSLAVAAGFFKIFVSMYPSFRVSRMTISGGDGSYIEFSKRFMGKNIFLLDLASLRRQMQDEAPNFECTTVQRRLPCEIVFYLRRRMPLAQLRLGRFYPIDQSGTIIGSASDIPFADLPIISGLYEKIPHPKVGSAYSVSELASALALIQAKNNNPNLKAYRLVSVNMNRLREPSFSMFKQEVNSAFMGKATLPVEIKFDPEDIRGAIKMLGLIVSKRRGSLERIEYIDLKNPNAPVFLEKKMTDVSR